MSQELMDKYYHRDVVISHNLVENVGGDGIVPMFSYKPLIEYNVSRGACQTGKEYGEAAGWYSAAIWPWRCYGALFQYNEASDTVAELNGDGMAFDCDYGENTVYQYNYSHDNGGGFVLFVKSEGLGSVFRYNVSVNDRREIILASNTLPAHFYNNTVINDQPIQIINRVNSSDITLTNNVFAYTNPVDPMKVFSTLNDDQKYNNNLYIGLAGVDEATMKGLDSGAKVDTMDNAFVNPGFEGDGFEGLKGYQLKSSSQGVNAGQLIKYVTGENGPADPVSGNYFSPTLTATDFFGNPVSTTENPDMGAINAALAQTMQPVVNVKDDTDPNRSVITVNTASGAKVTLWSGKVDQEVTADDDGVATFFVDKQAEKQGFNIYATAPGKSVSEGVTVFVPAKPTSPTTDKPGVSVKDDTNKDKSVITVTTEKGATVTLKDGDNVVKTATADENGVATFTIDKQAQSHDYTVTAKAGDKEISDAVKVTVPAKATTPPVTPPVTYPSPELTFDDGFVKDATVTQGKSFDPNAGIHAWQDGNHQTAIPAGDWKVDGKVDTSKTGTYTLTYTITNAFGKTTTLTRTIKVVADDSVKYTDINDVVFVQTTKASQYSYDDKTGQFTSNGQLKGLTVATAWKTARKAVTADGTVYYQVGANGWLRADDVTFSQLAKANGIVDVINPKGAKATDDPMASAKTIQTLPVNTGWKYSAVATNADGTRAYLVADRQWVQAKDVVERTSAKAKFVIGKTTAPTFTSDGNVVKNRTLKPGTAWKVTGIKYTNGHVYYRVATDLYVRADYGNFTA
ncbi:immunoglobulin-like domain-containing protein [Schleiferilactobacillus perolens]|uniref:immunoglobulin-like domain-containing protein n=1 Tax=Schleiferilactobacillus perolens TaxID=100468 RepID=UPI00138F77F4|nr:immunoglobulin-like domain-containing protein [Schleiferilactobacillus perolens]